MSRTKKEPRLVENLEIEIEYEKISLKWKLPNRRCDNVIIVKQTDHYANHSDDGNIIFRGITTQYEDEDVTVGQKYFYSIFSVYQERISSNYIKKEKTFTPKVKKFEIKRNYGANQLFWENPNEYKKILIFKGEKRAPDLNFHDNSPILLYGEKIYEGSHNKYKLKDNSTKFFYSLYVDYGNGLFSEPATICKIATKDKNIISKQITPSINQKVTKENSQQTFDNFNGIRRNIFVRKWQAINWKKFKAFTLSGLLLFWAIIPLAFVIVAPSLSLPTTPAISTFWGLILPLLWVFSSWCILLWPMFFPNPQLKRFLPTELLCTLIIGIPAMVFGAVSLLPYPGDFQWPQVQSSVNVNVSNENRKKAIYVFVLDVSKSFFTDSRKQNYDNSHDIMDLIIKEKIETHGHQSIPLTKPSGNDDDGDEFVIYTMAETAGFLERFFKRSVPKWGTTDIFDKLQKNIKEIRKKSNSGKTNISSCLQEIGIDLRTRYPNMETYSHINIMIFSDFYHEPENGKAELNITFPTIPNLLIGAFRGSYIGTPKGKLLIPHLESQFSSNQFYKIQIEDFIKRPALARIIHKI